MSQLSFKDQVIIVTGSGGGLGEVYVRLLASRGASVIVNDLSDACEKVAEDIRKNGGSAVAVKGSVTDPKDVERIVSTAVEKFGKVTGLINNAGVAFEKTLAETDMEGVRRVSELHYFAPIMMIKAVWPHMAKARFGRILNVTSSTVFGLSGWAVYSGAKAAMISLSKSLSLEGEQFGIHVNAMAPAATTAAMMTHITDQTIKDKNVNSKPELCGPLACYLMHPDCTANGNAYFNGSGKIGEIQFGQTYGAEGDLQLTLEKAAAIVEGQDIKKDLRIYRKTLDQLEATAK